MTAIRKSIYKLEDSFDEKAERFTFYHPYLAFALMLIAMPLFILMAVGISTTALILPVSWILGWI